MSIILALRGLARPVSIAAIVSFAGTPVFAGDGGGAVSGPNPSGPPTTVNRQIVNMKCDDLRTLRKQLEKKEKEISNELDEKNLTLFNWGSNLRTYNEQTVALEASLANASDAKTKRAVKKQLRAKARERRVAERGAQITQKSISERKRDLSAVENDLRITKKVMRNQKCR